MLVPSRVSGRFRAGSGVLHRWPSICFELCLDMFKLKMVGFSIHQSSGAGARARGL